MKPISLSMFYWCLSKAVFMTHRPVNWGCFTLPLDQTFFIPVIPIISLLKARRKNAHFSLLFSPKLENKPWVLRNFSFSLKVLHLITHSHSLNFTELYLNHFKNSWNFWRKNQLQQTTSYIVLLNILDNCVFFSFLLNIHKFGT